MAINLSDNIKISAPKPVDFKYLDELADTYVSVGAVNTAIPVGERHIGLTVNIGYSEYWYASGTTDGNLVLKTSSSGSTVNGAQNVGVGIGVYSGITETGLINLRKIVGSGNTNVVLSGDSIVVNTTGGTSLNDGILKFDSVKQTYNPYDDIRDDIVFYTGTTCPTGNTILMLNARLAVTELKLSTGTTHEEHEHSVGDIYWNNVDATMSIQQTADFKQSVGQELFVKIRNITGTLIERGSIVYINGSISGRPTIALARANSIDVAIVEEVIGMATEDIPTGSEGFVTTSGIVKNVVTSGFTDGDIVYLSTIEYGKFTKTRPEFPDFAVEVGIITNVDPISGSTYIRVNNVTVNKVIRGVEEANITVYSATSRSDFIAAYNNRHIYLPLTPDLGQQITIADTNGDASSWTITIHGNGEVISGTEYLVSENNAIINTDWGAITMVYNGSFWSIISYSG